MEAFDISSYKNISSRLNQNAMIIMAMTLSEDLQNHSNYVVQDIYITKTAMILR